MYVDTNGCEVDASGAPITATGVGMVAYTGNGTRETYAIDNDATCSGIATAEGWNPSSAVGIEALLETEGGSTTGKCTITLSDGTPQATSPGAGLVTVDVTTLGCVNGQTCAVMLTGSANSYNDTTHGTITGYAGAGTMEFTSTDGGSSWTLVYSAFTDSEGTITYTGSSEEPAAPEFTGTWSGDPDVENGGLSASSDIGTVTWSGSPPTYVTDANW